jgi:predicted DNA-binding transcriptional regulator YafY
MCLANSEKLLRLLRIIALVDKPGGAPLHSLIDDCGVCARTLYRYLEALGESGMPIYYDEERKRYRFASKVFLQPLTFTAPEATALIRCAQSLGRGRTPLQRDLRSAQEKILACLPSEQQKKVEAGRQAVEIRPANDPVEVCEEIFACVEQAIQRQRQLRIRYYAKTREAWTDRIVEPYVIVFRGGAWYLIAYCHLRQEVKIFRVDRIERAALLAAPSEIPRNFSAEAFLSGSWFIEQGEPVRVRLQFAPEAARWVRVAKYHPNQQITEQDDGSLLFEVTVRGQREITRWILGYGSQVEVLAPPQLRDAVRGEAERMKEVYG